MKYKSYITTELLCLISLSFALCLAGCVGPIALKHALPAYDETISQLQRDSLLINIARTRHKIPTHFTTTTNIAATFNFTASIGVNSNIFIPSPSGEAATFNVSSIGPFLSASASENPTIGLVPLRGEEFAKRILTPLDDDTFKLMILEGGQFDLIMRLMARGFEFKNPDGSFIKYVRNDPNFPDEYEEFRQIAQHLALLSATSNLFLGKLYFDQTELVTLPGPPTPTEILEASKLGYSYKAVEGKKNEYELTKRVIGNVALTNFPQKSMDNAELERLNTIAESTPSNQVQVAIRPGYQGGGHPIFGAIRLRSLNEILEFVANGITEKPEFHVDIGVHTARFREISLDPVVKRKLAWVLRNPVRTLAIVESESPPAYNQDLSVYYRGAYYYVADTVWDREAFKALYLIFNMSSQTAPDRGFPITISK